MMRWMELLGVGGIAEGVQDHGGSSFRDLEGGVETELRTPFPGARNVCQGWTEA